MEELEEISNSFKESYSKIYDRNDLPREVLGEISVLGCLMSEVEDRLRKYEKFYNLYRTWKDYDTLHNDLWDAQTSLRLERKLEIAFSEIEWK